MNAELHSHLSVNEGDFYQSDPLITVIEMVIC